MRRILSSSVRGSSTRGVTHFSNDACDCGEMTSGTRPPPDSVTTFVDLEHEAGCAASLFIIVADEFEVINFMIRCAACPILDAVALLEFLVNG